MFIESYKIHWVGIPYISGGIKQASTDPDNQFLPHNVC